MYAVRRRCRRLALLGTSAVNPRHSVPPGHIELLVAMGTGAGVRVPSLLRMAKRVVWCFVWALRDTGSVGWLRLPLGARLRKLARHPVEVLMKTWCFGTESLEGSSDFYYGELPRLLEERGVSCALLCGNGRGDAQRALVEATLRRTSVRSIPEWLLIPLWAPLATVWDQIVTSLALRRLARTERDPRLAMLCAYASLDCLTPATTRNALHFHVARAAVRTWRPKVFVTFYEGQPWEKPAWHGAKAASRECLTVGYQHTVVMPHSLALLAPNCDSWEMATPDVALCLGETTKTMMTPGHERHGTKLIAFGTFRAHPADGARRAPRPGLRTVLVLPEGIQREAKLIFDFAMRVAALLPEHHFIFRCHPALPFDRVHPLLDGSSKRCANIEVSTRDVIAEDFDRSSAVLYRGSSAVLYAILHGLKPVYLQSLGHPNVDPLFQLGGWRERVGSDEELAQILCRYAAASSDDIGPEWQRAVEYVKAYTRPVDSAAVDRFLQAVGLATATHAA